MRRFAWALAIVGILSAVMALVAAGILTPIWATLLARGIRAPATEMAAS